jgi:hypothetical protein
MKQPYETLTYAVRLSFKDAYGLEALSESYQRIRVLTPGLRLVRQEIWGEGDPLFDLAFIPGTLMPAIRLNGHFSVVSVLRERANVGDEIELYSTRRIHHAFKGDARFY